jgi:hypothetical protein
MHRTRVSTALGAALVMGLAVSTAEAQDASQAVADGGIAIQGWMGRIDAREAEAGLALENARLAMDGDALHVTTGPAVAYWNPGNVATGNYTVSAKFTEPRYMSLNNHPHPYGIFIGGNDLGTDQQSYLYCAAYGNGNFIVRGFGPEAFQMNGPRGGAHDAVNRAAGQGEPVSQEIAISVTSDKVECSINGAVVASYDKSEVVGDGRLKSTDGVYGVRFAHNTEALVDDLTITRQ